MTENIKKLKGDHAAHEMTGTHHLMVIVKGPKDLKGAKVGFVLIDPDGKNTTPWPWETGSEQIFP